MNDDPFYLIEFQMMHYAARPSTTRNPFQVVGNPDCATTTPSRRDGVPCKRGLICISSLPVLFCHHQTVVPHVLSIQLSLPRTPFFFAAPSPLSLQRAPPMSNSAGFFGLPERLIRLPESRTMCREHFISSTFCHPILYLWVDGPTRGCRSG